MITVTQLCGVIIASGKIACFVFVFCIIDQNSRTPTELLIITIIIGCNWQTVGMCMYVCYDSPKMIMYRNNAIFYCMLCLADY